MPSRLGEMQYSTVLYIRELTFSNLLATVARVVGVSHDIIRSHGE